MASITIDFSAAHAARIKAAFEVGFKLDRPATTEDLKDFLIRDLKNFVLSVEQRVARDAADSGITEVDFT